MHPSVKILAGPLAAIFILFFLDLQPGNVMVTRMAAVTVWMAIWWLTEAVHLSVTAFVPVVFLPLLGIADPKVISFQYMDQIIFLFIGGFLLSFAMERWNLHERIALRILMFAGTGDSRMLLGVMITSYVISMWISNTATVMMLISAVLAMIYTTGEMRGNTLAHRNFSKAMLIGLAYSATIGGMATLVGSPPNMVFLRAYTEAYPHLPEMTFTGWFFTGFPVSVVMLVVCYFILYGFFLKRNRHEIAIDKNYFSDAYHRLGKPGFEQITVAIIFTLTAALWFTRADITIGTFRLPGWSRLFPDPSFIQDSTVAVFMAMLLFLIPSKKEKGSFLLSWTEAKKLPFDIILLFGSGFALAKGFEVSGLSDWLAQQLRYFHGADVFFIILMIIVFVCFISEFASNVASIQLVIPILIAFQKELQVDPLLLMIPATLAASLGFMLPVATAPNTIVFGSRMISTRDMAKTGIVLDLAGILIIWLMVSYFQ